MSSSANKAGQDARKLLRSPEFSNVESPVRLTETSLRFKDD